MIHEDKYKDTKHCYFHWCGAALPAGSRFTKTEKYWT